MNEGYYGTDRGDEEVPQAGWIVRAARWVVTAWRPVLGWLVVGCCLGLALLPSLLLWENHWLLTSSLQLRLNLMGPLAVLVLWVMMGWHRPASWRPRAIRIVITALAYVLLGGLVITQLLGNWWPAPDEWWRALAQGDWPSLTAGVLEDLVKLGARYGLWWEGVVQSSAARDDTVLAGVAGLTIWVMSGFMVWVARRFRRGLVAAVPILWPVGFIMLYSPAGRWLFVAGITLALLLHLLLDQRRLVQQWQSEHLDYNPTLLVERAGTALAGFALVLAIAAVMPNLYVHDVTARYYAWLRPLNQQLETTSKRLFPWLSGVVPWEQRGVGGGLPNQFLLGAGPEIGRREVMQVRTNEPEVGFDLPPQGHNLRGATYSVYDGHGWDNPPSVQGESHPADEPWAFLSENGRRSLVQSVNLTFLSPVLYMAGEPLAASVDYIASLRFPGDLVSINARTRSYTAVSQVLAMDAKQLDALPAWAAPTNPLPAPFAGYLELPDTVTERTRALARDLTAGQPTMFAEATAIESYLRQFPYDLEVPAPPESAVDVADYFLFDLKRGYCDYYATAFVVLARSVGLPARFATGFAYGNWSPQDRVWTITEAEAHSWPEVYFPEVGWIPFEPTGGRPPLARVGLPSAPAGGMPAEPFEPLAPPEDWLDWRLAWWVLALVLPAGGIALLALRWRWSHEDPWMGLMRWGRRVGQPLSDSATPNEYGERLASFVQEKAATQHDLARTAAREMVELSHDVSGVHYAPEGRRPALRQQVAERWRRLRMYLRKLG